MVYDPALATRLRGALADKPSVREVKMFGGLSFMVNDSMVVSATSDGGLLVRADPERASELLATPGAQPAEMGPGRVMGDSWISVDEETIASEASLDFWIGVALEYNDKTGRQGRSRRPPSTRKGGQGVRPSSPARAE